MKVGDLVKMNAPEQFDDEWGVGVILSIEKRQATFGGTDVVVLWSKLGQPSWEMPEMLEMLNEAR